MPEGARFFIGLIGLVAWSVLWAIPLERRLSRWLVSASRQDPKRGAAIASGLQASALAGFLMLWLIGGLIGSALDDARWEAVTLIPALLLYGPLAIIAMPTKFGGYYATRRALQQSGARRRVARAMAWAGGWVAFVGFICMFAALETLAAGRR